jgi:hypothetical protein
MIPSSILRLCRVHHSRQLEEGSFRNRTAEFLWLHIFGAFMLVVRNNISHRILSSESLKYVVLALGDRLFLLLHAMGKSS